MNAEKVFLALLRAEVCGEAVKQSVTDACTPEMLSAVYTLANRHDLAHLVGQAASKLGLPESEPLTKCKQAAMQAVYRYVQLNYEYQQICKTLEEAEIPFIPLKGSVLRDYYPEPWMRTSCDIDVLVKEVDLNSAVKVLVEKLGYRSGGRGWHDVALSSSSGVHLELHFATVEEGRARKSQEVLQNIWNDAKPKAAETYHCCMSDEMFYFYHIAHMAKHLENGGCGVRSFLDLWLLNHKLKDNRQKREVLLSRGELLQFANAAEKLSEVWFSELDADTMCQYFEKFVLGGGQFGNVENMVAANRAKQSGELAYILSRLFLPYSHMKRKYPILNKHKWLTPFFQVIRWINLLFKGGVKRSVHELQVNAAVSREEEMSAGKLLEYLGLTDTTPLL